MRKKTCSWYLIKVERFGRKFKTLCGDYWWDDLKKSTFRFCPNCGGEVVIYKKGAVGWAWGSTARCAGNG